MADLEKDIGELKGTLKQFVPTVEKISTRVDENRDKITATGKELELHKKEIWRAVHTLEQGAKDNSDADVATEKKVADLGRDVQELQARSKGVGKFFLRVAEIVIAAVVGGFVVKMFGG